MWPSHEICSTVANMSQVGVFEPVPKRRNKNGFLLWAARYKMKYLKTDENVGVKAENILPGQHGMKLHITRTRHSERVVKQHLKLTAPPHSSHVRISGSRVCYQLPLWNIQRCEEVRYAGFHGPAISEALASADVTRVISARLVTVPETRVFKSAAFCSNTNKPQLHHLVVNAGIFLALNSNPWC